MAAGPHVVAKPNAHLKNNQTIKVSYTGFPANATVYVVQCTSKPTSSADALNKCDIKTAKKTTASATGTGSTPFVVLTGAIAKQGTCATVSKNCVIVAAVNSVPPVGASTHLSFGP